MSKFNLALIMSIVLIFGFSLPIDGAEQANPPVKSVMLFNYGKDETIYSKDEEIPLPPASLTKLMTALVVIDRVNLDSVVTVGNEVKGVEGVSIGLKPGDRIRVEDLLYALLLPSSNEVANALAAYSGGSLEGFTSLMNNKAQEMGLKTTNFTNAHGLNNPRHLSSAQDLVTIARRIISNPILAGIINTKEKEIKWENTNGVIKRAVLKNTNRLLGVYPGVIGMKTGTTREAGQCLVTFTKWDAGEVIAVLLDSSNRYKDAIYFLDDAHRHLQLDRAGEVLLNQTATSF